MHEGKGELAITQRRDRQPTRRQWRIRLVVAGPTQGDETIEIEVGATDVVNIEATAAAIRLAAPARAAAHLALDCLPFDAGGGRTAVECIERTSSKLQRIQSAPWCSVESLRERNLKRGYVAGEARRIQGEAGSA